MTRIVKFTFLIALIYIVFPFSDAFCLTDILNIRRWTAPDYTRIVIDTSDRVQYDTIEKDQKFFIVLKDTAFPASIPHQYILNKPAVKKILLFPLPGKKVRVEIWLSENVKVKVFKLGRILNKPHRIVVDVRIPEIEEKESKERKQVKITEKRKIIVIDPGHGGEDPGAVGRRGTKEKDVVLKIARNLRNILKKRGYRAFLTRNGDYYISFKKRLKIAREYGADLFISLHTDAHRSRGARGSSVYCLSTGGASSEAAKLLAKYENLSDVVAGVPNGQNNGESNPITLNMLQTETFNLSKSIGSIVLKDLKKVNRIKYSKVHEAPFRVLKLPDTPSILIEVAYISNPREELLLRKPSYRKEVAWAIASSVQDFFPIPALLAKGESRKLKRPAFVSPVPEQKPATYVVKRGDILERIARKHNTTVKTLRKLNHLKSKNRIYVGQRLKVKVSFPYPASTSKPGSTSQYVVKNGDTLEKIARKCGTTVGTLLKLNNMKLRDRIYVSQKLRIPSEAVQEPKPSIYVVKRGDTVEKIARRYGTDISTLLKLNDMKLRDRIYVSQKLRITSEAVQEPKASVYIVKRGDTLERIARRYGTDIRTLLKLNDMKLRDRIYVSQKLRLSSDAVQEPKTSIYIVKRRDTLEKIARRYGTDISTLLKLNDMKLRDRIYVSQKLRIPSEAVQEPETSIYIVKRGDTLERIARKNRTTAGILINLNNLKQRDRIYANQKLKIQ